MNILGTVSQMIEEILIEVEIIELILEIPVYIFYDLGRICSSS